MLLTELVSHYLGHVSEFVELGAEPDLRTLLRPPTDTRYEQRSVSECDGAVIEPGTGILGVVGPRPPALADPDVLTPVLRGMRPGARAAILVGWRIEQLPCHRFLAPLAESHCQIVAAVPLERVANRRGLYCALVIERVERVRPVPSYLLDAATAEPNRDGNVSAEPRTVLRTFNEYVLADFVNRPLRRRLIELEAMEAERTKTAKLLEELRAEVSRAHERTEALRTSTSYRVGSTLVQVARRTRAILAKPINLTRRRVASTKI